MGKVLRPIFRRDASPGRGAPSIPARLREASRRALCESEVSLRNVICSSSREDETDGEQSPSGDLEARKRPQEP